jgi:type II secretory pathway pseudopilin PulG
METPPSVMPKDVGETLIELLVAVVIMGIAVVAVVGGIATSITMSDVHRKEATAASSARDYAEALQNAIATGNAYKSCETPSDGKYAASAVGYAPPAGFTPSVASITYWQDATTIPAPQSGNPPGFYFTCPSLTNGVAAVEVQKVTLTVKSNDGRASESVDMIVRKP